MGYWSGCHTTFHLFIIATYYYINDGVPMDSAHFINSVYLNNLPGDAGAAKPLRLLWASYSPRQKALAVMQACCPPAIWSGLYRVARRLRVAQGDRWR